MYTYTQAKYFRFWQDLDNLSSFRFRTLVASISLIRNVEMYKLEAVIHVENHKQTFSDRENIKNVKRGFPNSPSISIAI